MSVKYKLVSTKVRKNQIKNQSKYTELKVKFLKEYIEDKVRELLKKIYKTNLENNTISLSSFVDSNYDKVLNSKSKSFFEKIKTRTILNMVSFVISDMIRNRGFELFENYNYYKTKLLNMDFGNEQFKEFLSKILDLLLERYNKIKDSKKILPLIEDFEILAFFYHNYKDIIEDVEAMEYFDEEIGMYKDCLYKIKKLSKTPIYEIKLKDILKVNVNRMYNEDSLNVLLDKIDFKLVEVKKFYSIVDEVFWMFKELRKYKNENLHIIVISEREEFWEIYNLIAASFGKKIVFLKKAHSEIFALFNSFLKILLKRGLDFDYKLIFSSPISRFSGYSEELRKYLYLLIDQGYLNSEIFNHLLREKDKRREFFDNFKTFLIKNKILPKKYIDEVIMNVSDFLSLYDNINSEDGIKKGYRKFFLDLFLKSEISENQDYLKDVREKISEFYGENLDFLKLRMMEYSRNTYFFNEKYRSGYFKISNSYIYIVEPNEAQFLDADIIFVPDNTFYDDRIKSLVTDKNFFKEFNILNMNERRYARMMFILRTILKNQITKRLKKVYFSTHSKEGRKEVYPSSLFYIILEEKNLNFENMEEEVA